MSEHYLGIMSGTSADGVDAALIETGPGVRLRATHFAAYPEALRAQLLRFAAAEYRGDPVDELGMLDVELGELFAAAALALIAKTGVRRRDVRAIGSHGQTVRHRPRLARPFTLQIGDPNIIAARTGITVVADFRRRDLALGGEGAPLVPAFHAAVFGHAREARAVVNIGGIANVTLLPAGGPVSGFDTGPGNVLLDLCSRRYFGQSHDPDGARAASGKVNEALLAALLSDDYFRRPPPKSTGREYFNAAWLERRLGDAAPDPADLLATLTELTACSIAAAMRQYAPATARVLVCGGGARNRTLLARLAALLAPLPVETTEAFGMAPDWVEAAAFAWFARETLAGRPGNLPAVTGAREAAVLGGIYPA